MYVPNDDYRVCRRAKITHARQESLGRERLSAYFIEPNIRFCVLAA